MPPFFAIVGDSGTGKTALVEHLVRELRALDLHVGFIKHAHHGFDADQPGRDSSRVAEAGAWRVLVVGPDSTFQVGPSDTNPSVFASDLADCDVVLAEGFRSSDWPKIVVRHRPGEGRPATEPVIAELFREPDQDWHPAELDRALDLILAAIRARHEWDVNLVVDGELIPVSGYAAHAVVETVRGLIGTLRGVNDPTSISLSVRTTTRDTPD